MINRLVLTILIIVFSSKTLAVDSALHMDNWRKNNLTADELAWLKENPVIIHGTLDHSNNIPFEFVNAEGEYSGLTADYIKVLSDKLGISFQSKVREAKRIDLLHKLQSNEINLITYIHKANRTFHYDAHFTDSIINMPIVLLGRENNPILQGLESLTNERIVAQKNTYAHKQVSTNYPHLKFQFTETVKAGIELVAQGQADIFIHNAFSIEFEQRLHDIKGVKIVSGTPYQYPLYFALSKEIKPLVNIIKKAIADISRSEKRLIFDKWINIKVKKRIDMNTIIPIILICIFVITFVTLFFTYWNRKLASEVSNRTAELRDLARYLNNIREQEKAKLARDMHDELGHSLISLIVGIKRLLATTKDPDSINKINNLNELVLTASKTSKRIMTDLRPSVLEDLGVVAAIDWLANDFKQKHNILCAVNARDLPFKLNDESAIALFRIVQESLTNAAKYSKASNVQVTITFNRHILCLSITDDGIGFEPKLAAKKSSYGLKGMRERAIALGGSFEVLSEVGKGVTINIEIPIQSNSIKKSAI